MIVLTGGAGFIGSCFLKKLNDNGIFDAILVDRLGTGCKWKNLVSKRFDRVYHKDEFFDVFDPDYYDIEAIIHLGACTITTERDTDYFLRNNLNYSIELALYALQKNIRFIYASSAATYGDGNLGYNDNEFFNLKPLNPYGLSKQLFDQWVLDNKLESSFTGIKFFNVFGPNEYHKGDMASMVFKAFNQIENTGTVKLFKSYHPDYKDGEQKRDFVYVKDVIEVLWQIFKNKEISGIFNLGSGTARTWNDLVKAVFTACGKDVSVEYIEMPESLKHQYQYFTQADMAKLKKSLPGFKMLNMEDSITDYVRNYLLKNSLNM